MISGKKKVKLFQKRRCFKNRDFIHVSQGEIFHLEEILY